jgi:hypothetical protein
MLSPPNLITRKETNDLETSVDQVVPADFVRSSWLQRIQEPLETSKGERRGQPNKDPGSHSR